MSARGTRATELLRAAGVVHSLHEYDPEEAGGGAGRGGMVRADHVAYGERTVAALGLDPARVFKTLVAAVDGTLAIGVVPVAGELDLKAFAEALGGRKAAMAPPAEAERATGYVVGGISPLGGKRRLRVVVDASAEGYETIFVSAGRRGLQMELAPGDLVRVAEASVAPIARRG